MLPLDIDWYICLLISSFLDIVFLFTSFLQSRFVFSKQALNAQIGFSVSLYDSSYLVVNARLL